MAPRLASKLRSPAEAAALVRPRDTLAIPLGPGQPPAFLHALGERDDWQELVVGGALLTGPYRLFTRRGVRLVSAFFGPVERGLARAGHDVRFVVSDFRRIAGLLERMRPRVMATLATPPDARGRLSLSLHAGASVAELHRCGRDPERLLLVETNAKLPRTRGLGPDHDHELSLDEVDVIVENDAEPFVLPHQEPDAVERAIAAHVAGFVADGSTLQTGIGGVPNAVAEILAEGPGGDYGIHTEMFTDGCMRLHRAGKVTNRKGIYDGFSVATFAAGTRDLYDWLDGQDAVRFLPVHLVNEPGIVARNRRMVSINGALSIDLAGQVAADAIAGRQHSGIGGHEDFTSGAAFSVGGHSLVCLPSTASIAGQRISRIVAAFPAGAIVTTPRHQIDVVVTEHGAARLAGLTVGERAHALVAVAHPDFRDELAEAAARLAPREDRSNP
jgi:acyl-CoA hydrolase